VNQWNCDVCHDFKDEKVFWNERVCMDCKSLLDHLEEIKNKTSTRHLINLFFDLGWLGR